MQSRMTHPVFVIPEAFKGLSRYGEAAKGHGVSDELLEMVNLRASQINGCSVCVQLHSTALRKGGESEERIAGVAAWRDAPYFADGERAALDLTEALTRAADRPELVSDAVWTEAARHYDEEALSALLVGITSINVWNRLNAATRQVAGDWMP